MVSIFLSHSSKDKFFARKLAETLRGHGVTVWIDEAELRVGDSLVDKISNAIYDADFVAAIISGNSVQSEWVTKELKLAMTHEIEGRVVKVLPILVERCKIPRFLSDKVYADFTDPSDFDGPLSRLLHAVGVSRPTTSGTAEVPTPSGSSVAESHGGVGMLEEFDDIRLLGTDRERTYRPDPHKSLYYVYLQLSGHPPYEWVQIFDAERQFPRHTMWRRAWVEDGYVVVHCPPDEVGKYHLNDLKRDVASSNVKYREYLMRLAAEKAKEAEWDRIMKQDLDDALGDLDFG